MQIALVNFMSRYLYSLASEDLLQQYLAKLNKKNAPGRAIVTLLVIVLVVNIGAGLIGLDPFTQVSSAAFGVGALCATILMFGASLSVLGYFARQPASERHWWKTLIAPIIASALLLGALVDQISGFSWITGSEEVWTAVLPWIVVAVGVFGLLFGFWIKAKRPRTYQDRAGDTAEEAAEIREKRIIDTAAIKLERKNARK